MIVHYALAVIGNIIGLAIITLVIIVCPLFFYVVPFYFNIIIPVRPVVFMVKPISMVEFVSHGWV